MAEGGPRNLDALKQSVAYLGYLRSGTPPASKLADRAAAASYKIADDPDDPRLYARAMMMLLWLADNRGISLGQIIIEISQREQEMRAEIRRDWGTEPDPSKEPHDFQGPVAGNSS